MNGTTGPQQVDSPAEDPARAPAGRRAAVLLTLLGAGLIILACTRTWATVSLGGNLPGMSDLTVSGRRLAPAGIPVGLAAAAGAVVLLTSGRVVRVLVAAGLVVGGALLAVNAAQAAQDTSGAVTSALRDSLGVFSRSASGGLISSSGTHAEISVWPWPACLGAVLLLGAGLLVLIRGWYWPGPTRRYERSGATVPSTGRQSAPRSAPAADAGPAGTWDALSRGEDPTSRVEDPT
jgi:uncharacterized membrane protein (TIGR02234 family)